MGDEAEAPFSFHQGEVPLLVSLPHAGAEIPPDILQQMTPAAVSSADTDWHVEKLYAFAKEMGASVLQARYSRYVIDLNRAPDSRPLYPGANNTELCPTSTFALEPLYPPGNTPDAAEILRRRRLYWEPYHRCLADELKRMHQLYGPVVLWEGHSIRSQVPRFFEGKLPDLNFGTADGASANPRLLAAVLAEAERVGGFTAVANARFKGGYITRSYGQADQGIQALQLELAQSAYMDEDPPFPYSPERAAPMIALLKALLEETLAWISRPRGD
ncbi:MAG: N-formylglutamate deformylase [Pseudomonadota bacterium]